MRFLRAATLIFAALAIPAACSGAGGATSSPLLPTAAPSGSTMAGHSIPPSGGSPVASGSMTAMTDSKAADLRTTLDRLLGEHIVLATKATGAALGGRPAEFTAYGDLLNKNGTDIGDLIGAAYGPAAKDTFNKIWSAHNGFFVDYTTGVAKNDKAMQDKAVQDLTTIYVPQFADFIAGATGLPKDAVTQLTTEHVLTTKAVVDAQGAKDTAGAAQKDRTAAQHMQMIADPLAKAIVAKVARQVLTPFT